MRSRNGFLLISLVLMLVMLPLTIAREGERAVAATPPGWVRLVIPGIASDAPPPPASTPSATGNRGLRIYVELEMFNEDRIQILVGDIRLPELPPVFSQPIKVRGKYRVDDFPSKSNCTWTQVHTDNEFGATIYWTPNSAELFVEFDWPHWEDWADCPHNDAPVRVAPPYPLEFHTTQAFQDFRDPRLFFHYRIPLDPTPGDPVTTHITNKTLAGAYTKGKLLVVLCRPDVIRPNCDWPPFGGP